MDIANELVAIIQDNESHKYLGRHLPGNIYERARVEVGHRIQSAWYKYRLYARTMTNRNISVKLRLKLFDAVVTPSMLFGLAAIPIHQTALNKIVVTQRKMIRKIVGWVRVANEPWETTMRRMKQRTERALQQFDIQQWDKRLCAIRWDHIARIKRLPAESWQCQSSYWSPGNMFDDAMGSVPYRNQGRPQLRWDDDINSFCKDHWGCTWQSAPVNEFEQQRESFLIYCDCE